VPRSPLAEMPEMQAVAGEAPVLAGRALARADAALASKKPPAPIDGDASREALLKLLQGVWEPAQRYA